LLQKFHHLVGMPFIALDIPTYHPLIASSWVVCMQRWEHLRNYRIRKGTLSHSHSRYIHNFRSSTFPQSYIELITVAAQIYAYILGQIPCQIRYADWFHAYRCLFNNADVNGSKRVGRIQMRTELAKNRAYISAKIWQFWIGHSAAYTRVLLRAGGLLLLSGLCFTRMGAQTNDGVRVGVRPQLNGIISALASLLICCLPSHATVYDAQNRPLGTPNIVTVIVPQNFPFFFRKPSE
jgi:hypothetical protein